MRRIAVINQKGGVGKTTTTVHLGAALAVMGKRVLLIDLDPQAHLTLHFGVETSDDHGSVYDVLTASTPVADVALHARENLTLVPSDIDLAAAEAELISVPGREVLLREAVDALGDGFDFLLVDCPPSLGVLTLNALTACDEVVIPLQAQFLALQGLGKLLNTVTLVRQRINPKLRVSGVVLCMHEAATKLSTEVVDDLSKFLDAARGTEVPWSMTRIFETRIRRNIKLAEAASFGQTVFEYAEKSNGALDYALLARELADDGYVKPAAAPAAMRGTKIRTPVTDGRVTEGAPLTPVERAVSRESTNGKHDAASKAATTKDEALTARPPSADPVGKRNGNPRGTTQPAEGVRRPKTKRAPVSPVPVESSATMSPSDTTTVQTPVALTPAGAERVAVRDSALPPEPELPTTPFVGVAAPAPEAAGRRNGQPERRPRRLPAQPVAPA